MMAKLSRIGLCERGHEGESYRLELQGGGSAYLCRRHWDEEMALRRGHAVAAWPGQPPRARRWGL